ncbi:hypothetical protein NIE88_06675 [Sporolactobacillus shoreicorticis]|uniref:Uncharacterized protein n=1 Tax=Sporolactobacillus shoreicorticis TaxID=1923877 RepID=A0ABW5S845_9BACL|nr:hypothetical protein [Sporolactobacillus shoreicorticis]MCO7125452.1 hypothetical protein [Sporolactobacillus shoreicorticis]
MRLRYGQILFKKGWEPAGVRFSARDLHNDIPNDAYPDFYLYGDGTFEYMGLPPDHFQKFATKDGVPGYQVICPLYDFNKHKNGPSYAYMDGSKYGLTEGVDIYNQDNQKFNHIPSDCKVLIPNGNYGKTPSFDDHGKIYVSGWQKPNGSYVLQSGYIDHDPTQYPSEQGINLF